MFYSFYFSQFLILLMYRQFWLNEADVLGKGAFPEECLPVNTLPFVWCFVAPNMMSACIMISLCCVSYRCHFFPAGGSGSLSGRPPVNTPPNVVMGYPVASQDRGAPKESHHSPAPPPISQAQQQQQQVGACLCSEVHINITYVTSCC
jgi:hypothetical protein